MITIILVALTFMAVAYFLSDGWDRAENTVIAGLFGLIVGFMVSITIGFFYQEKYMERGELVAIADGSSVTGSFFLGSGTINGKQVFSYYQKTGENSYILKEAGAEISTIVEDGGGYFEVGKVRSTANPLWVMPVASDAVQGITFHVPKGSVKQNYVLDAQ